MPGRLPGLFFKLVVSNMLENTSSVLFPQVRRRIAEMEPEALYPWDDFTDMMQTVAARLPRETLVSIGKRLVSEARESYAKLGFMNLEQILSDWGALFNSFIHGAPARDLVRTESFQPGRVAIVAGIAQPAALIEGYLRGVIEVYGAATVTSCEVKPLIIGGANYNRFVLTWIESQPRAESSLQG
ncbi:MAG: hypothetical protein ACAI38_23265 [Myxococcota bacterium]|nr:hypothetical protein [Myxococcota bacterium]